MPPYRQLLSSLLLPLALTACTGSENPDVRESFGKADLNCEGAALDAQDICRLPNGQFAANSCCTLGIEGNLAALLAADGAIQMPRVGVENNANEFSVSVTVVNAEDENLRATIEPLLTNMASEYCSDMLDDAGPADGIFCLFNLSDGHFLLKHGFQQREVRDALLDVVDPAHRAAIAAIVNPTGPDGFYATYTHYHVYDLSMEVAGDEIFVIVPSGPTTGNAKQGTAIIVQIFYVHA